jgi:hypothetical protein
MSERVFEKPEGRDEESDITFIRAKALFEALAESGADSSVVVEGIYEESRPNQLNDQKLDYTIINDAGEKVVVNGAGNLDYKMKFLNLGDYVQISYFGKKEITKGPFKGKESHDFEALKG